MNMLINGKQIAKSEKIEIINPANNEIVDTVPHGNRTDAKKAIESANKAKRQLKDVPSHIISENLYEIHEEILKNSKTFAKLITLDCGKPIKNSKEEVKRSLQTILLSAEEAKRIYGETIPLDACAGGENIIGFTKKIPLGVIGAITPFNFPLNLVIHKIAPAIAAKNVVVLKPSIKAPLAALKLAEIIDTYFEAGVINAITGFGREVGDEIVKNPGVDKISFTGSVETGLNISKNAGMKKLTLELGGNDPLIILEDADIDKAVDAAVTGSYSNAGQVCIGVKRIILDGKIADEFTDKFVKATLKLNVGDPMDIKTDVGPLIDESAAIEIENKVNTAINEGAELLCGGKRDGTFYTPTVLDNVKSNMNIVQEETFGPISPLIHVNGIDEAIKVANDTKYGLQAGIFTCNINNALKAAQEIDAGSVLINKPSTYRADNMPFGGCKMSGMGKEGIKYAVEDMTKIKLVILNPI
ncbi:MAG: aldehyde dehydrogenase family protein [Methanobacterium sp.]|uniref:lactaldehyde dehydrogenase n=1 Tax=Methanobacterium sp. TaxID=2164 RepID=UPI003D64851B|nr:aldehyde dehydrogenase family protein [Methanobacterium sp.]